MLIPIKVAEAFFAGRGALPINVKCMFEGEEEIGSPSLDAFIRETQGAARGRRRPVGGRRDVAHQRAVADGGESRTRGTRAHADRRLEGSALGPSRRRRRQSAARDGAADRDAARGEWTRRGRRVLRRGPRAHARRARRDRRAALRRSGVSRAGRRAVDVRRAWLHDARAPVDAADARGQRHVGRLRRAGAEDGDPDARRTRRSPAGWFPIRIRTTSWRW